MYQMSSTYNKSPQRSQPLQSIHQQPHKIHNDNEASVKWSHNMTTKGLRFIQMRENAIRKSTQKGLIDVVHLAGSKNPSMFTKEDKGTNHYLICRDSLMSTPLSAN